MSSPRRAAWLAAALLACEGQKYEQTGVKFVPSYEVTVDF